MTKNLFLNVNLFLNTENLRLGLDSSLTDCQSSVVSHEFQTELQVPCQILCEHAAVGPAASEVQTRFNHCCS